MLNFLYDLVGLKPWIRMSQEVKPLPRGLVSREGTPIRPSQRLPSFRSAMSAPAPNTLLTTSLNPVQSATTRGGVSKRVYKPTIPTRRTQNSETPTTSKDSENKRTRPDSKSPRGRGGRNNVKSDRKPNNNFVQLEAAVFNGIGGPSTKLSHSSLDVARGGRQTIVKSDVKSRVEAKQVKVKSEPFEREDSKLLEKLYRDDFLDDSSDDEKDLSSRKKPKGWELVNCEKINPSYRQKEISDLEGIPIDKWLDGNKPVMFQLPELFLTQREGIVGKLRVYKSGRVVMTDTLSGIEFDVVRSNNSLDNGSPGVQIKSENEKPSRKNQVNLPIRQDVISLSEDAIVSLGEIDNSDFLIGIPKLPEIE
ncbi:hypothetical protein HDE_06330 [Halotydeus destructor]|nr:hypothetical protein HDE_06330 [Halotydeus destructor]